MATGIVWLLLAAPIFWTFSSGTASSDDFCLSVRKSAHAQRCHLHSCKDKCSMTLEEIRGKGTQQMCHCDEKCVMFDDCCEDFSSVCAETYQEGGKKNTTFYTGCFGDYTYINSRKPERKNEMHSTSSTTASTMTTPVITESVTNSSARADENLEYRHASWVSNLWRLSQLKIDRTQGLLFSDLFDEAENTDTNKYNISHLGQITAFLEMINPFERIAELNFQVRVSQLILKMPQELNHWRLCLKNKYLLCQNCSLFSIQNELCYTDTTERTPMDSRLDKETAVNIEDFCSVFSSTLSTSGEPKGLVKVTAIPGPLEDVSIFLSEDLPWSALQCEHFVTQCKILSCAVGRHLSSDGKACFIPTRISFTVVKRQEVSNTRETSSFFDPQDNIHAEQNSTKKQSNTSQDQIYFPASLCVDLFLSLQHHTLWKFIKPPSREACSFYILPRSRNDNKPKTNRAANQNNRNSQGDDNRSSNTVQSQHRQIDPDSTDYIQNQVLRPGPINKNPDGMQQALGLLRQRMDVLPGIRQMQALEICLRTEPDQECLENENENPSSCRDRSSQCSSIEVFGSKGCAVKTYCSYLFLLGGLCAACLFAVSMLD